MSFSNNNPIGFFDSGVGGTSIWKEVIALLPFENSIYLSDSKNAPYGQKSKELISQYCFKNTEFLLERNSKIIVVACNTATTNAISILRQKYDVPFIGIEPAIKPAGLITKTKKVGILATKGTLNSDLFENTSGKIDDQIQIIEQIGEGLVDLIEEGKTNSSEMKNLLIQYLEPMMKEGIDALVLGCTHYPYLIPIIKIIIGHEIQIIDSGLAVAKQTKNILDSHNLLCSNKEIGNHLIYTNTNTELISRFLGDQKNIKIIKKDF